MLYKLWGRLCALQVLTIKTSSQPLEGIIGSWWCWLLLLLINIQGDIEERSCFFCSNSSLSISPLAYLRFKISIGDSFLITSELLWDELQSLRARRNKTKTTKPQKRRCMTEPNQPIQPEPQLPIIPGPHHGWYSPLWAEGRKINFEYVRMSNRFISVLVAPFLAGQIARFSFWCLV